MIAEFKTRPTATAPETAAASAADEAAIRALFQELLDAWGRGDGRAYAAGFTEDADYIAFDGSRTKGRQEIAAAHQPLFDRWLKGSRLDGRITSLCFLSPDAALIHADGSVLLRGQSEVHPSRRSIQTLIAVKQEGAWRFAAFHNCRVVRRNLLYYLSMAISTVVFRR